MVFDHYQKKIELLIQEKILIIEETSISHQFCLVTMKSIRRLHLSFMLFNSNPIGFQHFFVLSTLVIFFPGIVIGQNPSVDIGTQYQIHLGGFSTSVQLEDFDNVQDLGILSTSCIQKKTNTGDGLTHVYLGIYLGKSTAEKLLTEARARGYKGATLIEDPVSFNSSDGQKITSAIQIELQSRPDLTKLQSISPPHSIYLLLTNRGYQVLTLLHNPAYRTADFKKTLDFFVEKDYDAYPVKYR